ncbi:N2,N2-dimethylguanosine tRNA methyltransferase [Talaromyces stipitatus ATCC 10500]|uniref:tRNA (guanine(26)-N(2))-dimethyltransferase n=1 Tax=Talaromyces stipitatus (strain ATCC 10500 / CBS 375.48 / QM 6759 / NRRL 1006) TaxID=441959 RepID=B8MNW0_TALSN|nr:N2,N2-dimethylguanosine tRNA methyltransferase [Talaromyces stipitatus ATCC 10500]EED14199.1 N2,N2-dimethylguanosine tRNA methyltransferase [Talaromyces stipitatus ATCC 10500]
MARTTRTDSLLSGVDTIDTRSILSMQELDPSPVDDDPPDIETGDYFPEPANTNGEQARSFGISRIGLKSHSWDYWLSAIQRYSTYPPTVFFALHAINTSLIPLATRSIPSSDSFLLLTRPIYQSPSLEPIMVALPIVAHIASGIALRSIRARRRAKMYGAEQRNQRYLIKSWPVPSLQAKLGYAMIPLVGLHVGVNRVIPLEIDGGSSSVGLGYVAHGFARSPVFWNLFYILFVAASVWHLVGGLATWMGVRVTTARMERGSTSKTGILGETREETARRRKNKWLVHGIAGITAAIWLAGALGILSTCKFDMKWPVRPKYFFLFDDSDLITPRQSVECYGRPMKRILPRFYTSFRSAIESITPTVQIQYPKLLLLRNYRSTGAMTSTSNEAPASAPTESPKTIDLNNKKYEPVKEGLAYILKPISDKPPNLKPRGSGFEQQASVFYNPIQQFNRDLSVLAIKAFANHHVALVREQNLNRLNRRKKGKEGKKRKREEGEEDDVDVDGEEVMKKHHGEGDEGQRRAADEVVTGFVPPEAGADAQKSASTKPVNFQILDALSATGLRALRYAKEISTATKIVSNDLSAAAVEAIKLNIKYNQVENIVRPNVGDARAYMYSLQGETHTNDGTGKKFHVIDLDPYGTAAPFLDAAVQAVNDGGMLCVTCTDAAVFASTGYPEKTYALYGGIPCRLPHGHEIGLRLILHAVASSAARYGLAVEPLLSLSIDYYARVFVRIHKSPINVKALASTTMLVFNCDSGCGAWSTQYLAGTKVKQGKKDGQIFHNYVLAQAPTTSPRCEHCGFKTHLAGPMWGGPLHNPHFIQRVLDLVPESDPNVYHTLDRIEGMLTTALEEDLDLSPPFESDETTAKETTEELKPEEESAIIPRMSPHLKEKFPFFVSLSALAKVLHAQTIPTDAFRGALHGLGYRTTRSHTRPNSVRTDAPWDVLWEIMREWVRQWCPPSKDVNGEKYKPGTPAAGIMRNDRSHFDGSNPLNVLKKEVQTALEEGKDLADLSMRIEAALYRKGRTSPPSAEPTTTTTTTAENKTEERPHPSTLTIKFDESKGKKFSTEMGRGRKKVVRYQMNPELNWGPMSKATGH